MQLLVERGVGALQDLPASIANNHEASAETVENNLRRQRMKKDGWRGNFMKERELCYAIRNIVQDEGRTDEIFVFYTPLRMLSHSFVFSKSYFPMQA